MNKTLVSVGILCVLIGLLWPWLRQLPFGRLPGDILIVREHFRFFFPLTTCLVISLALSALFWLLRK